MSKIESVEEEFEEVSRSEIKRHMWALQDLGKRLMEMKASSWQGMGLHESVLDALAESKRIKSANARNRHTRRLGKLLSDHDEVFTQGLLEKIMNKDVDQLRHSLRLERWRDRLIAGDQGIFDELSQLNVDFDRQHLRQLIRNAQKQTDEVKLSLAKRKVFSYLKTLEI